MSHDLLIAVERGDLDPLEALVLMADAADRRLSRDPLLTTRERDALEESVEIADAVLLDVAADLWAAESLADLPITKEPHDR